MSCPDPETVAQWVEGRLPEFGREAFLEHLSSCEACREAALVLAPERRATERHIPLKRKGFAWGGWATAAASVVAAVLVLKTVRDRREVPRIGEGEVGVVPRPAGEPPAARPPDPPAPEPGTPPPTIDPAPQPEPRPPVAPDPAPPVEPEPRPPADPGPRSPVPPEPKPPAPPTRAVAAIRILDLRGALFADGKPVTEGALLEGTLTAPAGAGFRVDGHILALSKEARLVLSRDADGLVLDASLGAVYVEPFGNRPVRVAGLDAPVATASLVSGGRTHATGVREATEAARREWARLRPLRRTVVFEDFSAAKDGFERAAAQGGPIVGAQVLLPAAAAWSPRLALRIRIRTAARTVQVGALFRDRATPWAAMVTASGDGWREITVRASDFSAGPTGAPPPKDGDAIAAFTFSINTAEPGTAGASLDLDDLAVSLEE